ncbi:uncharacterized protein [Primulina eburnea]|uniref:uncharacterized protein isoform X2 n=1 Tax=Primulina eburnea TaxID=1245227 RepID=UPI003C6C2FE2
MAATIGWYGPLIDLRKASSHIGDYVQLLVFIHKSTPIQYKISRNGGEVVRLDILVGDETRTYFPVTIWQQQMASKVVAGNVCLLQNVKITKYGDSLEARTLHCSSLQCLIHSEDFLAPKGVIELIEECRVGITARDKLKKVVGWLQQVRLARCGSEINYYEHQRQVKVNWKVREETQSKNCLSLSELSDLNKYYKATFNAYVGEIFLPITWINLRETNAERMFISTRLHALADDGLVDDLVTTGCHLCGTPVNTGLGYENMQQNRLPLYCQRSSDRIHAVGTIYRPFWLYVWDDSKHAPILVTNKAAELLFGNIQAEKVESCYKVHMKKQPHHKKGTECNIGIEKKPNLYMIWLTLLKMLLQRGKNSPLKFKVTVDVNKDWESGRLEMVSVSIPALVRL